MSSLLTLWRQRGGGYTKILDPGAVEAGNVYNTVAALEAAGIVEGDRIGVVRGNTFREQFDWTANTVTVEGYGSGVDPIFDCRDLIAALDWSATGGYANIYEASVTIDSHASNTWVRVWEDGVGMPRETFDTDLGATLTNLDGNAGNYYPSADDADNITLYIHATGSADPTASGVVYSFSARQFGAYCADSIGSTIRNIKTIGNLHNNGSLVLGRNSNVYDCAANEGTKHNVFVKEGCYLENVDADEAYYGGAGSSMFVLADQNPANETVAYVNCNASLAVYDSSVGGFFSEVVVGGSYDRVTYSSCVATNVATAFSGAGSLDVRVLDSSCAGGSAGVRADGAASTWTLDGNDFSGSSNILVSVNAANVTIVLANNTLETSNGAGILVYSVSADTTYNATGGNIFNIVPGQVAMLSTGATTSITNNQNTFGKVGNLGDLCISDIDTGAGDSYTGDYNTYREATPRFKWSGGWVDFATWKTNTGQDANSTAGS